MEKSRKVALLSTIVVVSSALILSSCGRIGATSRVDPRSIAVYPGGRHVADPKNNPTSDCQLVQGVGSRQRGAIDLDCFVFPEDRPTNIQKGQSPNYPRNLAYARAVSDQVYRNRLAALLLKHSDDVCVEEMGRLTANEATVNASLNVLATLATTAANIVTGEQAQNILTGVGGAALATRSHVNADVYRNTVSHAISRAITIERQRLREAIEARYSQNNATFTVDDAIRAANQYHGVCSFYRGLELVLASVEGDQRTRDAQQRRTQIDELEAQIRRYRNLMPSQAGAEQTLINTAISELVERIQMLTLAAIPAPPLPPQTNQANGQLGSNNQAGALGNQAGPLGNQGVPAGNQAVGNQVAPVENQAAPKGEW